MLDNSSRNTPVLTNERPIGSYELLTQLTTGPSHLEIAAVTLRSALKEQYPDLNIDPDLAMVVTPRWSVVEDVVIPMPSFIESLTTVLARQMLALEPVIYIDGEHFLTLQSNTESAHLPVKIDAIARLINELAPLLYAAFQEQQLEYWNTDDDTHRPRWKVFANSLRKVWNIPAEEDFSAEERAMALLVMRYPEKTARVAIDPYNTRACLIDIDLQQNGHTTHLGPLDMLVLIGEHEKRPLILTYSLVDGYETFESLAQLGETLPAKLSSHKPDDTLLWRLYEPTGDIFEYVACTLIDLQIEAIGALGVTDEARPIKPTLSAVDRVLPGIEELSAHDRSTIRQVGEQLPDWLTDASDLDVSNYSRHAIGLAQLHTHNQGMLFDDGIAPIRDYARDQLNARIGKHANGKNLNLAKVEILIESPVIWGTFALPSTPDITRRSLIDLTLENLTGLPTGQTSVLYNGTPTPDWLSYSYLKSVVEAIDVGENYPALIKQVLLDDAPRSKQRQTLYTAHLRIQLPLLALQFKLQQEYGIDDVGYRYVAAALQVDAHDRRVDGQEIVIRHLAFVPTLRAAPQPDRVANMFVIGPKDHTAGPCLLYRPLLEPALIQFPSRQNLIYALKNDQALRDSVLAWLPEESRFNYAQFVFPSTLPSPWTVASLLIEPQVVVEMSGPITLTDEVLAEDTLATLFKANVNAMVELATRQSVSNVQKRWATYREAGWKMFNAALPFLGSTVGSAAWIWQIMDDLQQAAEGSNQQTAWAARVDLLFNLGMALAMHVATRQAPSEEPEKIAIFDPEREPQLPAVEEAEKPAPAHAKIIVTQQPSLSSPQLPTAHQGLLNSSGALGRTPSTLAAMLDSFKLTQPAGLGEQNKAPGPHRHLYPLADKWYTQVGERWFEVAVDESGDVLIIDPKDVSRTGPLLISNLAGQWFVDLRLRLRGGGGFKKGRRTAQSRKPRRIEELRAELDEFKTHEKSKHEALTDTFTAIGSGAGPSTDLRRQAFTDQVDDRLTEYDVPMRQLRSLAIIDAVPNYQSNMVDYLNKQLLLTRSVVNQRTLPFQEALQNTLATLETHAANDPKRQAEAAQAMSVLNQDMIKRMEYAQSRYRELQMLGPEGAKIIHSTTSALPAFKIGDLKAYEIALAPFLCVGEGSSEAVTSAREQVHDIGNAVDLNVQSLMEAVRSTNDSSLDERIEVLNSLVEQFAIVDQRLLDLHADYPEHVKKESLNSFRQQIEAFNQRAVKELVLQLRERKALKLTLRATEIAKAAQSPKKKIIKTRFNGVQIGEPNPTEVGMVDIKAPITGKVIATFHEKTPGVWVEREALSKRPTAQQTIDLGKSINAGQHLLDEETAATQRTLALAKKTGRIPVEVEEIFHQHAARLERAQDTIESALTQLNLTEVDHPSAAVLNRNLNEAAQRLYTLGTSTRISMIKQQPPTAERVEWLHSQNQVTVAKVGTRRRLKGPGKNYLDEYEVRDHSTHHVLWFAHFHYSSPEAGAGDYVAGHLKTREQQRLGGAFQRTGLSDGDQIAIYRSEISPQLAQSLFFATAPGG